MATSRFSLTLFWPMNSCRRWGRSFSSKEESSSTGAAETKRSFSGELSFAADTEGDGSSSVLWVSSCAERTLHLDLVASPAAYIQCIGSGYCNCKQPSTATTATTPTTTAAGGAPAPHELLPDHAQAHAFQFAGIEPGYFLAEPEFVAGE